jgi:DNA-binding protein Fis
MHVYDKELGNCGATKEDVELAMMQNHGNRTAAAKSLGIGLVTLRRKIKKYGWQNRAFLSRNPDDRHRY